MASLSYNVQLESKQPLLHTDSDVISFKGDIPVGPDMIKAVLTVFSSVIFEIFGSCKYIAMSKHLGGLSSIKR